MKKFFTVLFVVFGVLFLLQLIVLSYLFVVDPYNLKPILFPSATTSIVDTTSDVSSNNLNTEESTEESVTEGKTNVTAAQAEALTSVGLDTAAVQSFTPEQITCFESLLGPARVADIKAGAVPTMSEFYTVRECL